MGNGDSTDSIDHETADGTQANKWFDLVLTVVIALAAVGTAWAGFQSSKWSGVQANSYAKASAMRTESTRQSTEAGQLQMIDVITFTEWLSAANDERADLPDRGIGTGYTPDPRTLSGVLFNRFRPEFKPAVDAWLAFKPLANKSAPRTPFVMPEYKLAAKARSDDLLDEAEQLSARALESNQRSDNYVLTAVLLALVLFFATLTGRSRRRLSRGVLFGLTVISLLAAVVLLVTFPIEI